MCAAGDGCVISIGVTRTLDIRTFAWQIVNYMHISCSGSFGYYYLLVVIVSLTPGPLCSASYCVCMVHSTMQQNIILVHRLVQAYRPKLM